jgi:TRAP-type C4-dicarboxylate transport system substrate-binding protein
MKQITSSILLSVWMLLTMSLGLFSISSAHAQTISLTFADMHLPGENDGKLVNWYFDQVEKRSKGTVKIRRFWSQSLVKAFDQMDSVGKGVIDLTFYYAGFAPAKAPSLMSVLLPDPPTYDLYVGLMASKKLLEHPYFVQELKRNNVKFISPFGQPPERLQSMKPVRNLQDFKGLRVRTYGEYGSAVKAWGGVPVAMPGPEVYEALGRGAIDANLRPVFAAMGLKLYEVAKYQFMYPVGLNVGYPIVMNLDKWNSLPKEIKEVFMEVAEEFPSRIAEVNEKSEKEALQAIKEMGIEVIYPSPNVTAELNRLARPVIIDWEQRVAKEGVPGKELYDLYYNEVKRLSKQ